VSLADVLDEFPDLGVEAPAGENGPAQATLALKVRLSAEEARVLEVLDGQPTPADALASRAGMDAPRVSGALTLLELKGLVRALPGGRFVKR